MSLQAYFDDSGTKGTGRFMSMAGLFGPSEVLGPLATQWDRYLAFADPGKIPYFKMDEACGQSGAFAFWQPDKRDRKVRQMASIIDRENILEVAVAVDLRAYEQIFPEWKAWRDTNSGKHHALSAPYIMLFHYVVVTVVTEAVKRGHTAPMEVFFDNQDVFKRPILDHWDALLKDEEQFPERRAVMPVHPWFRDDKEWVLLQAADLLAGEMRLIVEHEIEAQSVPAFVGDICPKLKAAGHFKPITPDEMRALSEYTKQMIARERAGA